MPIGPITPTHEAEKNLICETYGVCPIYRANCRQGFFSMRREERMKRRNFEVVQ